MISEDSSCMSIFSYLFGFQDFLSVWTTIPPSGIGGDILYSNNLSVAPNLYVKCALLLSWFAEQSIQTGWIGDCYFFHSDAASIFIQIDLARRFQTVPLGQTEIVVPFGVESGFSSQEVWGSNPLPQKDLPYLAGSPENCSVGYSKFAHCDFSVFQCMRGLVDRAAPFSGIEILRQIDTQLDLCDNRPGWPVWERWML